MTNIDLAPHSTGYAHINGVNLSHEVYGEGSRWCSRTADAHHRPELLHPDPDPGPRRTVICVELQGNSRTADIDRPITPATLELAVHHPGRVRSIVAPHPPACDPDGLHEDLTDPAKQATSTRMPTSQDFTDFKQGRSRRRCPAGRSAR